MTTLPGVDESRKRRPDLLFLAWDCPWPAWWGGAQRTLGLLTELSKAFNVELLLLTRKPLSNEQRAVIGSFSRRITRIPLRGTSGWDRLHVASRSLARGQTYHCSAIATSLRGHPDVLRRMLDFPGIVYASYGHWGTLVRERLAKNWILDQQSADADAWRVYAEQVPSPFLKVAARVNRRLALRHFRDIYPKMGRVVSVCEEDRKLTLAMAPGASVEVIENGVDCSYYAPDGRVSTGRRLLFVGTHTARNMGALHRLVGRILPLVRRSIPTVQVVVGGNLGPRERAQFNGEREIVFTGPLDDLREAFRTSDVFVVPHVDTSGSQLKVAMAMAMGMPIVSTVRGIRGMPLVDGESVLTSVSDEEFADRVVTLLNDGRARDRLGAAARQTALARLDWPILGRRLVKIVDSVALDATARWSAGTGQLAPPTPRRYSHF
jgi:glycosyltransferase involved in cell wall biosynthesis